MAPLSPVVLQQMGKCNSIVAKRRSQLGQIAAWIFIFIIGGVCLLATGCSATKMTTTTNPSPTPTPPPSQPSYPTVPPVPITWSPSTSPDPAPAAVPPQGTDWASGASDFPLSVSNPTNSSTVTSPVNVVASATPTNPIFFMRVFVDQLAVYFTFNNSINTQIFVAPGAHTITVYAEDNKGYISAAPLQVTVSAQAPTTNGQTTITGIQALPGWQSCGAQFPPGSGRAGQICAAGGGTPNSTLTQNVSSPSMDGKSAEFSMASTGPGTPCAGYCNMLYFNPVAGGNNVTHLIYDLYFYIDNPDAPQALEFDMNQTYGGQRWTWGSECNFKADGVWDIWNDAPHTGWQPTTIPCLASDFQANSWNHLTWDVQQNGNQVQYNTLTLNGVVHQVNTIYPNEQNWTLEEIDTAFQMDLDSSGTPYHVWLDEVNLRAY
jgi:hypothetical protein